MTTLRDRLGVDAEELTEVKFAPMEPGDSRFHMYAIDANGFKVNFDIRDDITKEQLNNMLARQDQLSKWLALHEYSPDDFGASARSQSPTRAPTRPAATEPRNDNPACPDCGGETEYKQGKAANGKAWSGYFCIATRDEPKNRKHTPTWV